MIFLNHGVPMDTATHTADMGTEARKGDPLESFLISLFQMNKIMLWDHVVAGHRSPKHPPIPVSVDAFPWECLVIVPSALISNVYA